MSVELGLIAGAFGASALFGLFAVFSKRLENQKYYLSASLLFLLIMTQFMIDLSLCSSCENEDLTDTARNLQLVVLFALVLQMFYGWFWGWIVASLRALGLVKESDNTDSDL